MDIAHPIAQMQLGTSCEGVRRWSPDGLGVIQKKSKKLQVEVFLRIKHDFYLGKHRFAALVLFRALVC